jgi:hypothetical protein
MKDGFNESEQTAHKYFRDLGFTVDVPRKKDRRGFDFLLSLDYEGEKFSVTVEVKQTKGEPLLEPQLERILNENGLVVISRNGEVFEIFTKENIKSKREFIELIKRFAVKWE